MSTRDLRTDPEHAYKVAFICRNAGLSLSEVLHMSPDDLDAFSAALQAVVNDENMADMADGLEFELTAPQGKLFNPPTTGES